MRRLTQDRGFTIIEMMVAVTVLLIGALGTLAMLDMANKRSRSASDRQNAVAIGRQVLEAAKSIPRSAGSTSAPTDSARARPETSAPGRAPAGRSTGTRSTTSG